MEEKEENEAIVESIGEGREHGKDSHNDPV